MKTLRLDWTLATLLVLAVALSVGVSFIPSWARYLLQIALATALAASGVMLLLRAGLLSFGQGVFYFIGAYAVAFANRHLGIGDAFVAMFIGMAVSAVLAVALGGFICRYRGIFFAMLTLAITMVVYGIAVKLDLFGRSDGLNVGQVTYFGHRFRGQAAAQATFLLCVWTWTVLAIGVHIVLRSRLGKVIEAVEDNEVRLEYLGVSSRRVVHLTYIVAAVLASAGGALAGITSRHVDPGFSYWLTSGDFVFVVLLAGQVGVLCPLLGAVVLEFLRSYASGAFPDEWQLVLGGVMLGIVMFLPNGVGHSLAVLGRRLVRRPPPALAADVVEERTQ